GLPAIAALSVRLDLAVGMVRTIVIRVDAGATRLEHRSHVAVDLFNSRFGKESSRDSRLVGHHHHMQTGPVERAHGVDRPGIEGDALDTIEVADLLDDRAIAVEEHSGARALPCATLSAHNVRRAAA